MESDATPTRRRHKLPFIQHTRNGLCYWKVEPTGDYEIDNRLGSSYAILAVNYMREKNFSSLLGWIIQDMSTYGNDADREMRMAFCQTLADIIIH